jgi:hypothetical protein
MSRLYAYEKRAHKRMKRIHKKGSYVRVLLAYDALLMVYLSMISTIGSFSCRINRLRRHRNRNFYC